MRNWQALLKHNQHMYVIDFILAVMLPLSKLGPCWSSSMLSAVLHKNTMHTTKRTTFLLLRWEISLLKYSSSHFLGIEPAPQVISECYEERYISSSKIEIRLFYFVDFSSFQLHFSLTDNVFMNHLDIYVYVIDLQCVNKSTLFTHQNKEANVSPNLNLYENIVPSLNLKRISAITLHNLGTSVNFLLFELRWTGQPRQLASQLLSCCLSWSCDSGSHSGCSQRSAVSESASLSPAGMDCWPECTATASGSESSDDWLLGWAYFPESLKAQTTRLSGRNVTVNRAIKGPTMCCPLLYSSQLEGIIAYNHRKPSMLHFYLLPVPRTKTRNPIYFNFNIL